MIANVPAPDPHRSYCEGPRGGPAGWLALYVLGVGALMVLAAGLIVTDDGDPDAGSVLAAAIIVVPSLLLALRVGAWALLGPPLFCLTGFAVLIPLMSGDESGLGLAIGGS